ncbi:MAG: hypothetical protein IKB45_00395 [Clostridia bacterium]|nr:hypothetical protein [Clostridia bacterium]
MNFLSSAITAFCAACIFIGTLYILCPEGAVSKSVKYILSLVFLVSVIAAAGVVTKKSEISLPAPSDYEINTETLDTANAELIYSYLLRLGGIDFTKISVYTDKSADGSISISKVLIYSNQSREEILKVLNGAAENTEVEIINE